jgi:hypothetical protein
MPRKGNPSSAAEAADRIDAELAGCSKAGRYELELKQGEKTLLSTSADAAIHNGTTSFTAKLDLSKFDPGT